MIYEGGKFLYSHHATDPCSGRLVNAFDLVRLHLFPDDDAKRSFNKMADFALSLDEVKQTIANERMAKAGKEFAEDADWKNKLIYQKRSAVLENSVWNEILILKNDPDFANFAYNEMANRIQVTGPVPWNRPDDNPFWRDADTAQLKALLDIHYVSFSSRNLGLNLQAGGSTLIWFGLTWSLELYQQTNARLWRQGQKQSVVIHHIIAKNTIDENVMKALTVKDRTQEALIKAVKANLGGEIYAG